MATTPDFYVGEVGKKLRVTVKEGSAIVDLSQGVTHGTLIIKKKSGNIVFIPSELYTDGKDGKLIHTWLPGELDEAGEWQCEFFYVSGSGSSGSGQYYSTPAKFTVGDPLAQVEV